MKIRVQFEGGQSRYGDEGVNFLMPIMFTLTDEEKALYGEGIKHLQNLEEDGYDFYEEVPAPNEEDELKGYNEMADRLAAKFVDAGIDLHDVIWYYGSNDDGTPQHIKEDIR